MSEPKKLIEVAMPIKEISAESVRDGRIQHGHISSIHKWWARRPLPVCRAVIFASIVPDPMDEHCPIQFKEAIEVLLGAAQNIGDPYKPYDDIPYTSAIDKMEDNLRNRLIMFIGKFSEKHISDLRINKKTSAKELLSDFSLIKWENKDNEVVINKARKLIWIFYNSKNGQSFKELSDSFDHHLHSIRTNKIRIDSELNNDYSTKTESNFEYENSIEKFLSFMPIIFDPFAGGGAIPLEASRLGCRSFGNDINPVAHIIQKCSVEYPQKFGKRTTYEKDYFINKYGIELFNTIPASDKIYSNGEPSGVIVPNQLSFDFEVEINTILKNVYKKNPNLYDFGKESIFAIYWAKIGVCSNPTCLAELPLLRQFNLLLSDNRKIYLKPVLKEKEVKFTVEEGECNISPWFAASNLNCPFCGSTTSSKDLKKQAALSGLKEVPLAIIYDTKNGKDFRIPTITEQKRLTDDNYELDEFFIPNEKMVKCPDLISGRGWGFEYWKQMFSKRQLFVLQELLKEISNRINTKYQDNNEYQKALFTYLGLWFDRIVARYTSFGLMDVTNGAKVNDPFGRQAIPMVFDYPELNIFRMDQTSWITRVIESENFEFPATCNNANSGENKQFEEKSLTAVVTDPPYYDAIAYADLSDFFYVWLKRSISVLHPSIFGSPTNPKTEECTALKHHHNNNMSDAKHHFEEKLLNIFKSIERQTSDIVSIMFAHQSTEAWTTLCNSILGADMNITGSWANDTETTTALKSNKAFLSSSVTVSCKPSQKIGVGEFKIVKTAIEKRLEYEVLELYKLGFRGSDLLTACFGQAVSEFGRYEKVEKADGSAVSVSELLEIARESAFNSLLKGFDGDDFTKFYIGWLQLNGLVDTDFDDAAKFTKVGLSIDVQDLFKDHILIKNGNKQHLGSYKERINANNRLGEGRKNSIIDQTHRLMHLYSSPNRNSLLKYIESNSFEAESPVWRVLTSLAELLPKDIEDHKLSVGLLTNKDQLIREAKSSTTPKPEQSQLTFE